MEAYPRQSKQKGPSIRRSRLRPDSDNVAPIDPNIQLRDPPLSPSISFSKKSPSKVTVESQQGELTTSIVQDEVRDVPDPPVKVVVRIKPTEGLGIGETLVIKYSKDSLSVAGRKYSLDSVLDTDSTKVLL